MFDFVKLCKEYEKLSPVEKGAMLTEKAVKTFARLSHMNIEGLDPKETIAAFVIGSIVSDGVIDEREYLFMYPSLVRAFGDDFDFASIKQSFESDKEGRKLVGKYTEEMMKIIAAADDDLRADIISLCLLIATVDGKISLKERRYITKLIRA